MHFDIHIEQWPFANPFVLSRGSTITAHTVTVTLDDGQVQGRGECVPYKRYGESVGSVVAALESLRPLLESDALNHTALQTALPAGAARNALDCALWELAARRSGCTVWQLAGLSMLQPVTTAFTLSVDTAEKMGAAARAQAHRPLLKIKLAGDGDLERIAAIRENAPHSRLIVDANEGWSPAQVVPFTEQLAACDVVLIEQPLPADNDSCLTDMAHLVPFCADESCHTRADLPRLRGRYDYINIKLDKTGGLTEALALFSAAQQAGFGIMVGCMVGTSLAMAPAVLLAQQATFVDLDGPLLLAEDRSPGLKYENSTLYPPEADLWGA